MDEADKYKQRLEAIAVSFYSETLTQHTFICEKINLAVDCVKTDVSSNRSVALSS